MALISMTYLSQALMRTVEVQVILPVDRFVSAESSKENKRFKTLYLLHGVLGSNMDWISGTGIQRWAEARDLAVVMPSGENSFYFDHTLPNNAFGTLIGQELPAMMRRTFPLSDRREDTFIGGLSMGGYGALRNGLKYCDTFSHIIALSSAAHIFEEKGDGFLGVLACFGDRRVAEKTDLNPRVAFEHAKAKGHLPKIYMACGTEDSLLEANRELQAFFVEKGADLTYVEEAGGHDWDFWDSQIRRSLHWLPLETESVGLSSGHVAGSFRQKEIETEL